MLVLGAYNSQTSSVTPIVYYRIEISMIRCNFLQSFKKFCGLGSEVKGKDCIRAKWPIKAELIPVSVA